MGLQKNSIYFIVKIFKKKLIMIKTARHALNAILLRCWQPVQLLPPLFLKNRLDRAIPAHPKNLRAQSIPDISASE